MKIKSYILMPRIYVLNFDSQYDLCMSFVRIQEFYESPKFKGRYFSLESYIDYWSTENGNGSFTYPTMWNGFNVPGRVIVDWWDKFINDVREKERKILGEIEKLIAKEKGSGINYWNEIYIIGTCNDGGKRQRDIIVKHELAHALYCLYPEYKKQCDILLNNLSKKDYRAAKKLLIEAGYDRKKINDEIQAYMSTELLHKEDDMLGCRVDFVHHFNGFLNKLNFLKNS